MRALLGLLLILCGGGAVAAEPLWTAKGFQQPESALYVAAEKAIFVSNVNGDPSAKDGNGYLSRLKPDGTIVARKWVEGLNAPKGMGYAQGRLFVADIDRVVEIDVASAAIVKVYEAPGAKFLNDVALEPRSHFKGQVPRVYISDMADNGIWYLADGAFNLLVQDAALEGPNGLLVEGEELRIASWGAMTGDSSLTPPALGRLKTMGLDREGIADRFNAIPLGNLDGLEADGSGGYWVSSPSGVVWHVLADGQPEIWLKLEGNPTDIGIVPGKNLLVPLMGADEVRAYALPQKAKKK